MAPERSPKRQKTASDSNSSSSATPPSHIPLPPATTTDSSPGTSSDSASTQGQRSLSVAPSSQQASNLGQSWYSSWSRKAPPIAQVARDGIRSASNAASEAASSIKDVSLTPKSARSSSLAMTLGKGRSSRASLADVTTTMVHAEVTSPGRNSTKSLSVDPPDTQIRQDSAAKVEDIGKNPREETKPDNLVGQKEEATPSTQQETQNAPSSWLGWLAKGEGAVSDQTGVTTTPKPESKPGAGLTTNTVAEEQSAPKSTVETASVAPEPIVGSSVPETQGNRRSWLPIWNTETVDKKPTESSYTKALEKSSNVADPAPENVQAVSEPTKDSKQPEAQSKGPLIETSPPPTLPNDGTKASAWAFWSRDRKANDSSASIDRPQDGEIAVSNTTSQNHPKRASISVPRAQEESKPEAKKAEVKKVETKKVETDKSVDANNAAETPSSQPAKSAPKISSKKQDSKVEPQTTKAESTNAKAVAVEPIESKKPASVTSSKAANNLLLPALDATLKLPESPSLLLRLASLLYVSKEPELNHLSLVKDPPRIKNALAIGVHGYFPTPLIRSVLGQPTGTSIKFADMAAKSIKRWTTARGYECQVKTAALEGEGKIAERLELLWKLLLNWIEEIRKSDFVMVACHSQGVPVAIMLVAKLIQFGCVSSARICICAMAGINMGPFLEYKSRWIGGSAAELFEFSNPGSRVSEDYLAALDVVLKSGVRLTFIGSIDDQLVSLESSIFAPISHPHIFRAVSIDSKVHAPNFLSHLVGFALKLRNLGVQDHGLIRELSSPLAGSLYTGEGHSRIYEDDAVYDLAVSFALETNALVGVPISQRVVASGASNPYILPFAMRGILEEDFVKNELQGEASDLLKEFDDWKPTSKVLKDVKFRLEGIRSKL